MARSSLLLLGEEKPGTLFEKQKLSNSPLFLWTKEVVEEEGEEEEGNTTRLTRRHHRCVFEEVV
jgi:hypothetical protein